MINVFALWVAAQYIDGFVLAEGIKSLLIVGAGFSALHMVLKPILKLILGPINFLTLGLIDLVIDAGLLYLLTLYFPQISITVWNFAGFESQYLTLPAYEFNVIGTTIISAFLINMVRSTLTVLASND